MQYNVVVKQEAELDLDEAINWYENQRDGLGIDFLLHFEESLIFVRNNPYSSPKVLLEYRKIRLNKFPYLIYYTVNEQKRNIDVYAVLHTSRNPLLFNERVQL